MNEDPSMINGQSIAGIIKTLLLAKHSEERIAAAKLLARKKDPRVVDGLIRAHDAEEEPEVKKEIISSLGSMQEEKSAAKLLNLLNSEQDPTLKKKIIWVLGKSKVDNKIMVAFEDTLLTDENHEVRYEAVCQLGKLRCERCLQTLENALLLDPHEDVKKQAVWSISEIQSPKATQILVRALPQMVNSELKREIVWVLSSRGNPQIAQGLARYLKMESDPKIMQLTIWAIGKIDAPLTLDILHEILDDENYSREIRSEVIWLLGRKKSESSTEKLLNFLKKEDRELKKLALWALGEIKNPKILKSLQDRLKIEKDPEFAYDLEWLINDIKNRD